MNFSRSNASASFMKDSQSKKLVNSYLLVLCGVIVLTWYIQWLWKRRYLYIHSWNIPGPFALPFIGAGYLFIFSTPSDILETVLKIQKEYPEIGAFWLGPKLVFTVGKPEYVEKVLTSSKALNKSGFYKFLNFAFGEGLLTAKGQKWRKHRKNIMPAFNQRILNKYQEIFVAKGEVFADILEKNDGNKEIDFLELVSNCTLDIICETTLGLDMNLQTSDKSDFSKNLDKIMEITIYRIFHIWHHLEFTWNWYPISREFGKVLETFKNFTGAVIRKKLEVCDNKQSSVDCFASTKERGSFDNFAFLDVILENSNFTELELREEVEIFLVAGSDTTASTLSCIFTMLGMFQDVQQKVLEEILDIVGPDRRVLHCDLPEMKYTERVIKESLRLFPIAVFFARTISEDIDAGDVVFPAGSDVYFGVVHIHRNPKYWTDPLKFDPDRFLPDNVAKRHPCTYIPFSYGPRNCVGGKFAMMNIKTILATVLRRFKIYTEYKSIEEIKLKLNLVLKMKDGPKVWVESR